MKGLFNKFKDQVKDVIKNIDKELNAAGITGNSNDPSRALDSDDASKKREAFRPRSRTDVTKEYIDSDRFFKLFQTLEDCVEKKDEAFDQTDFSLFFKERPTSISSIFYEKVKNQEKIDIGSQEIFDLITSSQEASSKENKPLLMISVIGFHHKKGTVLEYSYPSLHNELGLNKELADYIEQQVLTAGMPDAVHNASEDFVYFIINLNKRQLGNIEKDSPLLSTNTEGENESLLLYGISFFKQIPVTEAMRKKDPELTRSHLQKAVCILSKAPIFGHILAKLDPVTKCYFSQDDFDDTQILQTIYDNINTSLKDVTINTNELLAGINVKKIIFFLKEKAMILWKAIFLEKKILIYSQNPSACSTFIHSLLALFPCLCHFKYQNKALNLLDNHYNEYGLPLRFFHDQCPLIPYFSVQHLDHVIPLQGFLAGTSNPLIKTLPKVNWDILFDIDHNSMQFKNDSFKKLLALSKPEKEFIQEIVQNVKGKASSENLSWKNIEGESIFSDVDMTYEGSDDWIRQRFYDYIKFFLSELEVFRFTCSEEHLGPLVEGFNSDLARKATTKTSPLGKPGDIFKRKSEEDSTTTANTTAASERKKSGDSKDETTEEEISQEKKEGSSEEGVSPTTEEKKETSPVDVSKSPEEKKEEEKRGSKEDLNKDEEDYVARRRDSRAVIKQEFANLKETIRTLKAFGVDWILEWSKTKNFKYWLSHHEKIIGQRSVNSPHSANHIWFYENGDIYFGDLRAGRRHGRGQFVDRSSKLIYRGDFNKDAVDGEGSLASIGNSDFLYDGHFKNHKKEGYGRLIRGKERYAGTFKRDKYEGNGVLVDKDQNVYEGEFRAGLKAGMGKLQMANGDMYTGEFSLGLYHGKGQIICKNGEIYSGDFAGGKMNGYGYSQLASGDVYEGEFSEGKYNGKGLLKRKDGPSFMGVFEEGELLDNIGGVITFPDGSKYEGLIMNYKPHGLGILTKKTDEGEELKKGRFEDGELVEEIQESPTKLQSDEVVKEEEEVKNEAEEAPKESQEEPKEAQEEQKEVQEEPKESQEEAPKESQEEPAEKKEEEESAQA